MNKIRPAICLLLVLCLTTVFSAYKPAAWQYPKIASKTVLLAPAFAVSALGSSLLNQRTHFKFSDGRYKCALILEQMSIDLIRASVSFLTEFTNRFAKSKGQTSIIIRAPPCPNF